MITNPTPRNNSMPTMLCLPSRKNGKTKEKTTSKTEAVIKTFFLPILSARTDVAMIKTANSTIAPINNNKNSEWLKPSAVVAYDKDHVVSVKNIAYVAPIKNVPLRISFQLDLKTSRSGERVVLSRSCASLNNGVSCRRRRT